MDALCEKDDLLKKGESDILFCNIYCYSFAIYILLINQEIMI